MLYPTVCACAGIDDATAQPSDATMTAVLSAFMSFLLERVGAVFGGPPEQLVTSWHECELHASRRPRKPSQA